MPVRRVVSHDAVKANTGRVAIERGPLVYAAEFPDNGGRVMNLALDDRTPLSAATRADLLGGVTVVTGSAMSYRWKGRDVVQTPVPLTLIPYYAWAHRGRGEMEVWLARDVSKARPAPEPTLASNSRASSSEGGKGIEGLNEQIDPLNSNDHTALYLHWWPKKGTVEWAQYDFAAATPVSEVSVYWFDDTGEGECRVPRSWRVLYQDGENWKPVEAVSPYVVAKDTYTTVAFKPVRTKALRLEVTLPAEFSAGVQEWKVR
jgi:hypothetical protein